MNRKLTLASLILVLIAFSTMGQILAQNRKIGVNTGDTFIYTLTSQWSSTNGNDTIPPYFSEINKTSTISVTISAVQNTNVNATITWSFTNGTDLNSLITLDAESGAVISYVPNSPVFEGFYIANLFVGERLRPTGNNSHIIGQIILANYTSGVRETNVAELTSPVTNSSGIMIGSETQIYYIDKITGALVQSEYYTEIPDQNAHIIWLLKETNVWAVSYSQNPSPSPSIPEFPTLSVIPILMATILATLIIYKKKSSVTL